MLYAGATGGAATLLDIPAITDTVFTVQGSTQHFIFTDAMQLLGAAALGATITQGQIYSPSLIPYGLLNLWPLNAAITPSSYPRMMDFRMMPFLLPMNEQIQFLASDSASETVSGHLWIAPQTGWSMNQTRGISRGILKLTSSVAIVGGAWTGPQVLTFQNLPQGGWYVVNSAWCLCSAARCFRLYFPRAPTVSGRQLRPGDLVQHAVGDLVEPGWANGLGSWGAFHTFEPVQAEFYGDTTGASTQQIYLDVQYLGQGAASTYPLTS